MKKIFSLSVEILPYSKKINSVLSTSQMLSLFDSCPSDQFLPCQQIFPRHS